MMKFHGFGQAEMIERYGIVGFPLIETRARFLRPMQFGDELVIVSRIESHTRKTFKVRHRIYNLDAESVSGYETRFWGIQDPQSGGRAASLGDARRVCGKVKLIFIGFEFSVCCPAHYQRVECN